MQNTTRLRKLPWIAKHNETTHNETAWPHAKLTLSPAASEVGRTRNADKVVAEFLKNIHLSFTRVLAAILRSHPRHPSPAALHLLRIILLLLGLVVIYGTCSLKELFAALLGKTWKIYATNKLERSKHYSKYKFI